MLEGGEGRPKALSTTGWYASLESFEEKSRFGGGGGGLGE